MAAIHTIEVELLKLASHKSANIDKGDFSGEWRENIHRHPDRIEGHHPRDMMWRFTKERLASTSAYCRRDDLWDRTCVTSASSRRSWRPRRHASAILTEFGNPDIMRFLFRFADGKGNLVVKRPCSKTCISTLLTSGLFVDDMKLEPAAENPEGTLVVEVPVDAGKGVRTAQDLSMWEQLSFAAFLQRYWADNQVSCTTTFDPETEGQHLAHALDYFQYQLKGVSFLPRTDYGAFPQMPYEAMSEDEYKSQISKLRHLDFSRRRGQTRGEGDGVRVEEVPDRYCESESCTDGAGFRV